MKTAIVAVLLFVAAKANAGTNFYTLSPSTPAATGVVLATGSGSFNRAEISTGAAGDFCAFVDSAAPAASPSANDSASAKELLTLTVTATNTLTPSADTPGRPFVNGVSAICSAARKVKAWISQ